MQISFFSLGCFLAVAAAGTGCAVSHPPSNRYPGLYSTTTALPLSKARLEFLPQAAHDYDVLFFKPGKSCGAAFASKAATIPAAWDKLHLVQAPGIVPLNDTGLGIDEVEIPNSEWHFFQQLASASSSVKAADLQPQATALPTADYFSNPFYNWYPVVGISYEQAVAFCQWRSRVVTAAYNEGTHHADSLSADYLRFTYRLPTEAEWESAGAENDSLARSTSCTELPITVNPKQAAYLHQRSGTTQSAAQIEADIIAYNRRRPTRSWITFRQSEPYFLQLRTPVYAWQGPANFLATYQLLGNVAELVQQRGITKGGSYQDPLETCTLRARGTYTGPAATTGFRCVCQVAYPNRR